MTGTRATDLLPRLARACVAGASAYALGGCLTADSFSRAFAADLAGVATSVFQQLIIDLLSAVPTG